MNKWIVYSLKCRKGQAGFALPVAIGMGLIILLVGLTMLLRSQDSQVSAIAQKDTAKSLNAAETGVNEIRALINQHRAIAEVPACKADLNSPPTRNSDGTCPDSGSEISWALPDNISNIFSECDVNRKGNIIQLANREWQDVDAGDPSQGQYRLLSYTATDGLTVQGRVNNDQPNESVSELQVSFPLSQSQAPIAKLWVSSSANTTQVDSDVLTLGPCSSSSPIQASAVDIPAIPSQPVGAINLSTLPAELPRSGDSPNTAGVYQYAIDTLDSRLTVTDGEKVELWVDGDITLEVDADYPTLNDDITCNTSTNCSPLNVKIYGEGNSSTPTITISDRIRICNVFIHAPDYTVESSSSASIPPIPIPTCGAGQRITGVFWVKEWGNTSSPVLHSRLATPPLKWSDLPSEYYPPQIGPINTWETKELSAN